MTVSLVPSPSPPPVLSLQYEKNRGRGPGDSYHVVCDSTDESHKAGLSQYTSTDDIIDSRSRCRDMFA